MSNYQNGNNNGQQFTNHEDVIYMLHDGRINPRPGQNEVQQRIQKYGNGGQGSTNPQYTNSVGGPQVSGTPSLPQQHDSYNGGSVTFGGSQGGQVSSHSAQSFGGQASQGFGAQANSGFNGQGAQANTTQAQGFGGIEVPNAQQLEKEYLERYPRAYGIPIVAVKKRERGVLEAFMLQNGQVLDYGQMIQAAFDKQLQGIEVQNNREGEMILRSTPDGYRSNNLDQLPEFH